MSIELAWDKLDSTLSTFLVDLLNRQIANTQRPSFIGPVEVTSLDFGSVAPDVELIDLRDIYRDFLEAGDDDEDDDHVSGDPVKVTEGAPDDDAFEWVSRKATRSSRPQDLPAYHQLPPHVRYGRSSTADMFASTPALHSPRDIWNGTMSLPSLSGDFRSASFLPPHRFNSREIPEPERPPPERSLPPPSPSPSLPQPEEPEPNGLPNLQLHFQITWQSDLRITLTTSLLINYPSPMFMSLPIKLSVTGLLFAGEIAVAYEGERRRVHLCILDDLDPYGPACDRSKRESASNTPPEL